MNYDKNKLYVFLEKDNLRKYNNNTVSQLISFRGCITQDIVLCEGYKCEGIFYIQNDGSRIIPLIEAFDIPIEKAMKKNKIQVINHNGTWICQTSLPHENHNIVNNDIIFCKGVIIDTINLQTVQP